MGSPFFTILMPTRNRAELLQHSIRTALAQTFDDFEVLVSANNCTDNTEEVARSTGDSRVRLINPGKSLTMPDHWDFALTHARGRYVTCLCDDDAIVPDLLAKIESLIRDGSNVVAWNHCSYYYEDCPLIERRGSVDYPLALTGKTRRIPATEVLTDLFSLDKPPQLPRFLNSCNSLEVSRSIRNEVGNAFPGSCPDYSYPALLLARVSDVTFIDQPLCVAGWSSRSIGAATHLDMGTASEEFMREFTSYEHFANVPLKAPVVPNYIADTLEEARKLDFHHEYPPFNVVNYVRLIRADLDYYRAIGLDMGAHIQSLERYCLSLPSHIRIAIDGLKSITSSSTGNVAPSSLGLQRAELQESSPLPPTILTRLRKMARSTVNAIGPLRRIEKLLRGPTINDCASTLATASFKSITTAAVAVHRANRSLWRS